MSSEKSNGSASGNPENPVNPVKEGLPNSRKVYVNGEMHSQIRVPFREINLAPTKTMSGEIEVNEPVRVYDTSGPWGDADFAGDVEQGLPPLRVRWILQRGDVEGGSGRAVTPQDNGYLSDVHAKARNGNSKSEIRNPKFERKALRAKPGICVTQLYYARQGVITPEMEFIAIRENAGRANSSSPVGEAASFPPNNNREANSVPYSRNDLRQQHPGESFGASIPREITPE